MVEEREAVGEIFAVMEKREEPPVLAPLVAEKKLVEIIVKLIIGVPTINPEERDDAKAVVFGDDYVQKTEIVFVEVACWPKDTPFLAFLENQRTEREAVRVGIEDGPEHREAVFVAVAERPEIDGAAAVAVT